MFSDVNLAIQVILALLVAAVLAWLVTPVVKIYANHIGAIDVPRDGRRMHTQPMPRMGGLAIFLGFCLSVFLFATISNQVRTMLLGALIIVVVGALDDKFSLGALPKLLVQILAALVAVAGGNIISCISNPNVYSELLYLPLGLWAVPVSVIWIVLITNAVNLIDGLDGLAAGVSAISSATMLLIALMLGEGEIAVVMAGLLGACLGFLPYNKNPASIFMGDTGSTFLGYVLAVVSIQGLFKVYSLITFAVPFLMLGLPVFDTLFAICRRISHGQNPLKADRGHVHHRLMNMGLNQKQTVMVLYVISAALGMCAVLLSTNTPLRGVVLLLSLTLTGTVAAKVLWPHLHAQAALQAMKEALPAEDPSALKVMTIFGTRPEAVKMCPLVLELQNTPGIRSICCVSAQHRQMLDGVLQEFGVIPDYDLNLMKPGQTLSMITSGCLKRLEPVLQACRPDLILVHGDTSTTFAGALAAHYQQIPVGHVEAGLRTGDRYSPFPEELNRRMTGDLSTLHFAPTPANRQNLALENIHEGVYVTGNTVIDAMKTTVRPDYVFENPVLAQLDFAGKKVICVTCHRRENYGKPMEQIMTALKQIVTDFPEVEVVYPVHLSPQVQQTARAHLADLPRVHLIEPVSVVEMHNLLSRCYMVMTDSGGLQEEAPALGKPVLVLRRETERPEAVAAGTVKVAGVDREEIYRLAATLIRDEEVYNRMARAVNPYGDGQACRRIVQAILYHFKRRNDLPEEFEAEYVG